MCTKRVAARSISARRIAAQAIIFPRAVLRPRESSLAALFQSLRQLAGAQRLLVAFQEL